jgi:YD repeat-containing protein
LSSTRIYTVEYTTLLDYDAQGNVIYVGYASPGSLSSQPVWRIKKMNYDAAGNLISVKYADGDLNFDNVWDDRENLTYG